MDARFYRDLVNDAQLPSETSSRTAGQDDVLPADRAVLEVLASAQGRDWQVEGYALNSTPCQPCTRCNSCASGRLNSLA